MFDDGKRWCTSGSTQYVFSLFSVVERVHNSSGVKRSQRNKSEMSLP